MRSKLILIVFSTIIFFSANLYALVQIQDSPPERVPLPGWGIYVGSEDIESRNMTVGRIVSISDGKLVFSTANKRRGVKELEMPLKPDDEKKIVEEIEAGIKEIEKDSPILKKIDEERERVLAPYRKRFADDGKVKAYFHFMPDNDGHGGKILSEEVHLYKYVGEEAPFGSNFPWMPWQVYQRDPVQNPRLTLEDWNEWDDFWGLREAKVNELKYEALKRHLNRDQYQTFVQLFAGSLGVNILAYEEFKEILRLTKNQRTEIDEIYLAASKSIKQNLEQWQSLTDGGAPLDILRDFQQHVTQRQLEYEDQLDAVLTKRQLETVRSWRDRCSPVQAPNEHAVLHVPFQYDLTSKMSKLEYELWKRSWSGPSKSPARWPEDEDAQSNSEEKKREK